MMTWQEFNKLPLDERLAILKGDGQTPADARLTEHREAAHEAGRGLSAPPGARDRYLESIAPYLESVAQTTPDSTRRYMMLALSQHYPPGAIAVAFKATDEEMEFVRNQPPINELPADEIARLQALPYKTYLRTEYWQKTRADALKRAEHRCQLCGCEGHLQVHHRDDRSYKRLGCERPADLLVLCDDCHSRYHGKTKAA